MIKYSVSGKFNIGEKVLVQGQIIGIQGSNEPVYTISFSDGTRLHLSEKELKKEK